MGCHNARPPDLSIVCTDLALLTGLSASLTASVIALQNLCLFGLLFVSCFTWLLFYVLFISETALCKSAHILLLSLSCGKLLAFY